MIIWRGWGVLVVLLALVGGGLGSGLGGAVGQQYMLVFTGLGLIAAGFAIRLLGQRMNVVGVQEKAKQYVEGRRVELHALADQGTFHLGPGYAPPRSVEEAHEQAEGLAIAEGEAIAAGRKNLHTLFFVPMQHWAFVAWGAGLILAISSLRG